MKRIAWILFAAGILLYSCTGKKRQELHEPNPLPEFIMEKLLIDLTYPPFEDTVITVIMEGLGLCGGDSVSADSTRPPCSHELFRVFQNGLDKPWNAGFLIEVKKGIYSETYRVLHIAYVEKKYRVTNDYTGELLEMHTTPSGNYDMVIRYPLGEGTIAILHQWNIDHYEPVTVLEINDHFVKPEKVDSLDRIYIDHFAWGF
jgi:hypothetical protein